MRITYNILIRFYSAIIHLASLLNRKAKLWVEGRKNIFEQIEKKICAELKDSDELIWFHCASLGEFEQGRPVLEKIKVQSSKFKVLLTFFSPSGYEIQKSYKGADFIFYLPLDTPLNAKRFVELLPLKAVFFVKYEFWFNYLIELNKKRVPTYLISGIFREEQYFFKWYGGWARKQLKAFTHFFLQDAKSKELLTLCGFVNTTVSGDTRFDRVYEIALDKKEFPLVKSFADNASVLIAGSTWEKEEELIVGCKAPVVGYKIVVAPHEISAGRIKQIVERFSKVGNCLLYSEANQQNVKQANILIIDNIGILSSIYQYGHVAYIGGGFGDGIHNILEAATFGLPTIFGPNHKNFIEAVELIEAGGAFLVKDENDLREILNRMFNSRENLAKASAICKKYVLNKKGASEIILKSVMNL